MTVARAEKQELARGANGWFCALRGGAVLLGALLLAWPAFFNGFPLLYPDSMTYLTDGRVVARALFLHQFSDYYGVRSFFYSLVILPFHWNISPWPIVALQCLLVAFVLWLVVRSIVPLHTVSRYLVLILALSLLTSASWFAAFIMPDVLGPLVYLSIYLLAFARETLSRSERMALYLIAWWGITAHSTHLLLAAGLWLLLVLVAACQPKTFWRRLWSLGEIAAILAVAAASQMALHGYLYGEPTLNGQRPPYLMARVIADGPGLWYLDQYCPQLHWAICDHLSQLSGDPEQILWDANGAYQSGTDEEREQIDHEEMPLVRATLGAYPLQQLSRSAANFWSQLLKFRLIGFSPNSWMQQQFNEAMPRERASYFESRQAHNALPLKLFTKIERGGLFASLAAIAALLPFLWRHPWPRLASLTLVVAAVVVANALVAGVLSMVDDRYGCRVIWLIPLLAGLFVLDWLQQRETCSR